jgi:AraC family transcriptional regulator
MQKSKDWIDYSERLSKVQEYIHDNLDEELSFNRLAEIAYLSPYHFHRIYRAATAETIAATVRRLRIYRAASHLAHSEIPVSQISQLAGYKNVQSFTRVFNEFFGMPPAKYRNNGNHTQYPPTRHERNLSMYNVNIKNIADLEVVSIEHKGAYNKINKTFDKLFGWLGQRGLVDAKTRVLSIGYDDPATVPENELRSRACATLSKTCSIEAPIEKVTIDGGRYAVLRYKGPYDALPAIYQWLFGTWLLESGMRLRDTPPFEEYLNTPLDTAPSELLTDIYIPLA